VSIINAAQILFTFLKEQELRFTGPSKNHFKRVATLKTSLGFSLQYLINSSLLRPTSMIKTQELQPGRSGSGPFYVRSGLGVPPLPCDITAGYQIAPVPFYCRCGHPYRPRRLKRASPATLVSSPTASVKRAFLPGITAVFHHTCIESIMVRYFIHLTANIKGYWFYHCIRRRRLRIGVQPVPLGEKNDPVTLVLWPHLPINGSFVDHSCYN